MDGGGQTGGGGEPAGLLAGPQSGGGHSGGRPHCSLRPGLQGHQDEDRESRPPAVELNSRKV